VRILELGDVGGYLVGEKGVEWVRSKKVIGRVTDARTNAARGAT
jgi:hypothetical protein